MFDGIPRIRTAENRLQDQIQLTVCAFSSNVHGKGLEPQGARRQVNMVSGGVVIILFLFLQEGLGSLEEKWFQSKEGRRWGRVSGWRSGIGRQRGS